MLPALSVEFRSAGVAIEHTVEPQANWYAALPKEQWPDNEETLSAIASTWIEPYGDRMQELVFIGIEMDRMAIEATLEACLLTEAEMDGGPEGWKRLADPFGMWRLDEEHHEPVGDSHLAGTR